MSSTILAAGDGEFEADVDVLVIGGGACGCTAALAAKAGGGDVLVVERDQAPRGNTSLSGGQIPAGGTKLQQAAGIEDSPELLAGDLIAKAKGQCDQDLARHIASEAYKTVDWLVADHEIPLTCVTNFLYPGHSRPHMHATAQRFGADLLEALLAAVRRNDIDILCAAHATHLFAGRDGTIRGVRISRPDGRTEDIGCKALVLACNGYGANKSLLREHIPDMADAAYLGHEGNQGDAVIWGRDLGASVRDMGAFQGHGAVCTPHMVQIAWPVFTEGGFQVNQVGQRFSNENAGYSEQARKLLAQPGGVAWGIWDQRCEDVAGQMHSHVVASEVGAIRQCQDVAALAAFIGCDEAALAETVSGVAAMTSGQKSCGWGRDFTGKPALQPPYFAARITGALFHTQGGLEVDKDGRVLREDGSPFPNLFAGGGAARGLSGPADWGYLSGSGLLMAVNLGRLSGIAAARVLPDG